jgi:hypothetical protein
MRDFHFFTGRCQAVLIIILLSGLAFAGCHTTHASPHANAAVSHPTPPAASSAKPSAAPSSEPGLSHPSKLPPRDSEFTVYRNPDYGVSFRYPRNYALEEGPDSDDATFVQQQQELTGSQPGAILVATVTIPDDAYPNTSFQSGTLEFVVNPEVTPDACRALALSADSGLSPTAGSLAIHGIAFDWRLSSSTGAGTYVENVEYAGYSGGACYEFLIEISASSYVEPDSEERPADIPKILRGLEKIVSSFQVHRKPAPTQPR